MRANYSHIVPHFIEFHHQWKTQLTTRMWDMWYGVGEDILEVSTYTVEITMTRMVELGKG